ncbi:MAG: hypothetical protein IJT68_10100 [Lentisphaeria bacterium]|nr:hypothetical protein [Lentisphaeria bacterium]MBR3505434.1 hypothetical protein [Lentisphaeria bacterium]
MIRNGSKNTISDLIMAQNKKKIMFLGDGKIVMSALFQYASAVPAMIERYECLGAFEFTELPAPIYMEADIVVFSLFRQYGSRVRAEGIPALENRLNKGKCGILFSFGSYDETESPLVWNIMEKKSLAEKLDELPPPDAMATELRRLKEFFRSALFKIDGHRL